VAKGLKLYGFRCVAHLYALRFVPQGGLGVTVRLFQCAAGGRNACSSVPVILGPVDSGSRNDGVKGAFGFTWSLFMSTQEGFSLSELSLLLVSVWLLCVTT
jgi:hypothetical protein